MSDHVPGPVLWFLHLPKAGGTTMAAAARREYGRFRVLRLYSDVPLKQLRAVPRWRWRLIRAVSGHFPLHGLSYASESALRVTVLREPVARLTSLYHYILREPGHHSYDLVRGQSLVDFLLSDHPEVVNHQASYLAPDGDLGCAVEALDSFDLVGTTERLHAVVVEVARQLGWKDRWVPHENRRPEDQAAGELSPEVRDEVLRRNDIDRRLYEMARERSP